MQVYLRELEQIQTVDGIEKADRQTVKNVGKLIQRYFEEFCQHLALKNTSF